MAESPTLASYAGAYYLLYHNTSQGEEYRIGQSLAGPWSEAYPLPPGWANEFWVGQDKLNYSSYLIGYDLVIERLVWNVSYDPPRITVSDSTHWLFIPFALNP